MVLEGTLAEVATYQGLREMAQPFLAGSEVRRDVLVGFSPPFTLRLYPDSAVIATCL